MLRKILSFSSAAGPQTEVLTQQERQGVEDRASALLRAHQLEIWKRTDRLFLGLLVFQWLGGIVLALWLSPVTWEGAVSSTHPHVWQALWLGLILLISPFCFVLLRPGETVTRHVIAVSQMLSSALLIHLGGGRIEMHFHVFGSLAFLAFYRDWRVLISASVIVAADHLLRGIFIPASVYGVINASPWRWLEHAGWVVFEDVFLITSCLQGVREMSAIAERQAFIEHSYRVVEDKVRVRTHQLEQTQEALVKAARSAGMAEIATSVLHNVGNVLNSLNVSVSVVAAKVQESPVQNLGDAVELLFDHKSDLAQFLTDSDQGREIPGYLRMVAEVMADEQTALLGEVRSLEKNVEHIKRIVAVQQSHARTTSVIESVNMPEVINDALEVNCASAGWNDIKVRREIAELPAISTDKHVVLQILINLLTNARHALSASNRTDKELIVRGRVASRDDREFLVVEVADNGMGIDQANLTRIFNHGFTTKKDGHGFGLHSAANAIKQLGGSIHVHSDGLGTGATFTLELPCQPELAIL